MKFIKRRKKNEIKKLYRKVKWISSGKIGQCKDYKITRKKKLYNN